MTEDDVLRKDKNFCLYCKAEIPFKNRHGDPRSFCKGHENKLKNPNNWIRNKGVDNYGWKGGRKKHNKHGIWYWEVLMPNHPRAHDGYVMEHIIVAEQKLGKPLKKGEVIHHIDGNSLNNDPNNLLILPSQSEHMKLHKVLNKMRSLNDVYPNLN